MMPGMIMLWYGSKATIPSGWGLCDGSNGTPNLATKMVMAVGGPINPGDTGGNMTHDHDFTGDGHAHDLAAGNKIVNDSPNGSYDHQTSSSPATGTTDNGNSMPPYHALCYIMKLPIP